MKSKKKEDGEAYISTVVFDNFSEVIHDRVPIGKVKELTDKDYYVRGCTALLDAVGGEIHHIGNIHKYAREEDRPERTRFIITTDGMENASRKYSYADVKKMIERQKEKYGWEFLFLGANIDSATEGAKIGINRDFTVDYCCDSIGTRTNYDAINETISYVRACAAPLSSEWKGEIEADRKRRQSGLFKNKKNHN